MQLLRRLAALQPFATSCLQKRGCAIQQHAGGKLRPVSRRVSSKTRSRGKGRGGYDGGEAPLTSKENSAAPAVSAAVATAVPAAPLPVQLAWKDSKTKLRSYQQDAISAVHAAYAQGKRQQLVVMPTGTGKTVVFAALARQFGVRTLILVHRLQLVKQTLDRLEEVWPGVEVGILQGKDKQFGCQVTVATIQTASIFAGDRGYDTLKQEGYQLLIVDEAHHSLADSYQTLMEELGFLDVVGCSAGGGGGSGGAQQRLAVGVTATPARGDKQALGEMWELAYELTFATAIDNGWLSPVTARRVMTHTDLRSVRTSRSKHFGQDFKTSELSAKVNSRSRNLLVVDAYQDYAAGRKAIAFCVDVAHTLALAETFREEGIAAEAIHGRVPPQERQRLLQDLKEGKLRVLVNCEVLIEGFDEPSISCVLMARPTKSNPLYIQCVGRGLRLSPGKKDCVLIDFTDRANYLASVTSIDERIKYVGEEEEEEEEGAEEELSSPPKRGEVEVDLEYPGGVFEIVEQFAWAVFEDTAMTPLPAARGAGNGGDSRTAAARAGRSATSWEPHSFLSLMDDDKQYVGVLRGTGSTAAAAAAAAAASGSAAAAAAASGGGGEEDGQPSERWRAVHFNARTWEVAEIAEANSPQHARRMAESIAERVKGGPQMGTLKASAKWRAQPSSMKQLEFLDNLLGGVPDVQGGTPKEEAPRTKGQVGDLITCGLVGKNWPRLASSIRKLERKLESKLESDGGGLLVEE